MWKFLPDWVWDPGGEKLTLALLPDRPETETRKTLTAQQGAFLDEIVFAGSDTPQDLSFKPDGPAFTARFWESAVLEKSYALSTTGPAVHYRIAGRTDLPFELRIASEIAGDYAENLRIGRPAIEGFIEEGCAGVRTARGETVRMTSTHQAGTFAITGSFHAVKVEYRLSFEKLEEKPIEFTLSLAFSA
jgi:hypothetical protein